MHLVIFFSLAIDTPLCNLPSAYLVRRFSIVWMTNKPDIKVQMSLKELRHDIFIYFFDGLSHSLSFAKLKTYGLLMKEKTKGVILKQKGTRMAEDGEDWNGLKMTILNSLASPFKMHERWRSSFKRHYKQNPIALKIAVPWPGTDLNTLLRNSTS